ncbi:DUF5316 family protein [Bacillus sp. 1P06AnD]|uniref:DUF5316 family protein n=1 Tax=Bacillus sp. 1P06AnD TaxID=3132208 RepID=UPI00399EFAAF
MKKVLFMGLIILVIDMLISLIFNKIKLIPISTGITGMLFLCLAALMVGIFVPADSRRVDVATESNESLNRRSKWSTNFLLISLPSLIVCAISFILIYK